VTTGGDRTLYDVLIGLHVAAALIGFGAVAMNGAYGGNARRVGFDGAVGATAREELRRYFRPPGRAEWLICIVPFLGVAALAAKPGPSSFGQAWVVIGIALWVAATVVLFGVVRPAESVLHRAAQAPLAGSATSQLGDVAPFEDAALGDGAPFGDAASAAALGAAGRRLQWAAATSDLIFLVALIVMVIQPGS
jgi:uncharacterized membrane protein